MVETISSTIARKRSGKLQFSYDFVILAERMNDREEKDDIDFEPEDEVGSAGALKAKLEKLKADLAEAKKERQEYLDGWQRCKADSINARKDTEKNAERRVEREIERIAEDVIHALDSFDMARESPSWEKVDEAWRSGMENVRSQLLLALLRHDIEAFGKIGEQFDPRLHEIIKEIASDEAEGVVLLLMRSGYKMHDRVIRPAHVAISAKARP